jgi:hypothetical protein
MQKAVSLEIAKLPGMGLSELRELWTARFGTPPKHRAPDLLRRILAWRLQVEAFGGLDSAIQLLIANDHALLVTAAQSGMRLAREYAGRRHEVVITEGGVLYDGNH